MVLVPSASGGDAGQGDEEEGSPLSEVAFCLGEGEDSAGSPFSLCSLREKVRRKKYDRDFIGGGGGRGAVGAWMRQALDLSFAGPTSPVGPT